MAAPGGGSDKAVRFMVELIKKHQLAPITITPMNKHTGLGAEAFTYFLKAPDPDHILLMNAKTFYMVALRRPELKVNISLFTPIALMGTDVFLLWVHGDRQEINTMADFVKAVQAKKKETGQDWVMAGSGADSEDSMLTGLLNAKYKLTMKYLPCASGAEVARNLLEKKANSTLNNPSEVIEPYRSHTAKPIVTFSAQRLPAFPDTPTLIETGDNFSHDMPRVVAGPPGMSQEAQLFYARLFKKVYSTPEWQAYRQEKSLSGKFITGPALTEYWQNHIVVRRNMLSVIDMFSASSTSATAVPSPK